MARNANVRLAGDTGLRIVAGGCRTADANADPDRRGYAIVGVNIVDPTTGGILVNARVVEDRCAVDSLAFDSHRVNIRLRGDAVNGPWYGHGFRCDACTSTAGRQNGVSHAAGVAIKNHIFNRADFLPV